MPSAKQTEEANATEMKRTTVYIPRLADRALDRLANETGKKKNRLYLEGIDHILKQHGQPALATKPRKGDKE